MLKMILGLAIASQAFAVAPKPTFMKNCLKASSVGDCEHVYRMMADGWKCDKRACFAPGTKMFKKLAHAEATDEGFDLLEGK